MTAIRQVARNPTNPQIPPPWPIEGWCDPLTGQRLRREFLGSCTGGRLIIGELLRSSGYDLYFRRRQNANTLPRRGEMSDELRRFLVACWRSQLRRSDKVVFHKQGTLVWLGRIPLALYGVDQTPGGEGSILYRYHRLVQRPRGALNLPSVAPAISARGDIGHRLLDTAYPTLTSGEGNRAVLPRGETALPSPL